MQYDDEELELLGAMLDDELAGIGALSIRPRFATPVGRGTQRKVNTRVVAAKQAYMNKIQPAVPGAPAMGARKFALGLGQHIFLPAAATTHTFSVSPQRPFKGYRLVADIRRSAGAVAELVTLSKFNIGADNQLVGSQPLPLAAFVGDAVDTGLALDPATPGINIDVTVDISAAPGAGEQVAVSLMLIGDTIG